MFNKSPWKSNNEKLKNTVLNELGKFTEAGLQSRFSDWVQSSFFHSITTSAVKRKITERSFTNIPPLKTKVTHKIYLHEDISVYFIFLLFGFTI